MINKQFNKEVFRYLIRKAFPPVYMVLAYGSGVFQQTNNSQPKMIDLLMVVDDCRHFHIQNMKVNPQHYSGLSYYLGEPYVHLLNQHIFPIHFNSHIPIKYHTIKYGVLSKQTLYDDLKNWDLLTISGRLHKPIRIIQYADKDETAFEQNLVQAVSCAIILLNKRYFSERELFCKITEISYVGDMRFSFGLENTKKVQNIVDGNIDGFRKLYQPILYKFFKKLKLTNVFTNYLSREQLVCGLPQKFKEHADSLEHELASINKRSSTWMGAYHMLSSSWLKNYQYSLYKHKKTKR